MASLRLDARPQNTEEIKADVPQTYAFRILLSTANENNDGNMDSHWDEIEIIPSLASEMLDEELPK